MNGKSTMNLDTLKTPRQDAQGRWHELLTPTQVLTGQQQQQQSHMGEQLTKKKKKCRGDRKAQRQRRRLRRKGLYTETVTRNGDHELNVQHLEQPDQLFEEDISDKIQVNVSSDQIPHSTQSKIHHNDSKVKKSTKRKRRDISSQPPSNTIHESLSQLTISPPSAKKQKMINNEVQQITTNGKSEKKSSKCKKQNNHNNKDSSYVPDYLKVSNRIFKQMLISSLDGAKDIVKRLNSKEKINYIRQYTCLIHRLFYVQLQESQWQYYYDTGIQQNIWSGRVSKKWAAMNSMNYTYGRSKNLIAQRLKKIERQLQEVSEALQNFGQQPLPQSLSEMNPPLDFTKLNAIVTAVVRKGQHKLKQQFEHNKKILILDSTDHRLVKNVYDLKPNKQQIRSIRNIWKAIYNKNQMEEQIEILKHRIHSNCLPPAFNLLDYSLDRIDKKLRGSKQSSTNDNDSKQQTILAARRLKKIGRFKYDLLELNVQFINGVDVIRKLKEYQEHGYLTTTTLFVIFDVTDLYTMIPRDGAIAALTRFCKKYSVNGKIGNLKMDTIIQLACVVLDTNSFAYKDKYYRQIKGGAMGSPFTMVLANIYMLEWEQKLIQHQQRHHEIYGRYIDDVFMTTNLSKEEILKEIDKTTVTDSNIKITTSVNQSLEYLDVTIENDNGHLRTSIYHKSASEPYILPYESDHPRHLHINIIHTGLVRAARLCSTVEDFDMERLSLEMILLVNGYPPEFIRRHMTSFFIKYDAMNVCTELTNELYQQLHHTLLYKETRREMETKIQREDNLISKKKKYEHKNEIYLHYTFENGPLLNFKKEYRQIWEKYYVYPGSRLKNTRLILGTILNRTLQSLLIHKKPKRDMLRNMEATTEAARRTINERFIH
ncbi:unnamed protein product [Rotaria sp. Silwood1]|nr:unnamed protein product [Rotaria sp. Silwood1]